MARIQPLAFLLFSFIVSQNALADPANIWNPIIYQWKFYLDINPDLRPAGIVTEAAANSHWQYNGVNEGRRASAGFHSAQYLALNPDVAEVIGATNYNGAILHYLNWGMAEGRPAIVSNTYGLNFGSGETTFGNQAVTIRTSARYSGTVTELWFRGRQFVNSHDTGRLFQSAYQLDYYGECYNPTEGGMGQDGAGPSQSVLQSMNVQPATITASTKPAFWLMPGTQQYCGTAQGAGPVSPDTITKTITVGVEGDPQIVRWNTRVSLAQPHTHFALESLTGYHNDDFNRYYAYDPFTKTLQPRGAMPLENPNWTSPDFIHFYPPVFATADGQFAIGVVPLDHEQQSPGNITRLPYVLHATYLSSPDPTDRTTKWSISFHHPNTVVGNYDYVTFLVFGNLSEVRSRMEYLYQRYPQQWMSLVAKPGFTKAFNSSFYSTVKPNLWITGQPLVEYQMLDYLFSQFGLQSGIVSNLKASSEFSSLQYLRRYADLTAAYGPTNTIAALKHYLISGNNEGRIGRLNTDSDFNHDSYTDVSVFRPFSTWITTAGSINWGTQGDIPIPADFDGDGQSDLVIYRPSEGGWYVKYSSTGYSTTGYFAFGASDYIPVPGDYTGDAKAEPAIFRPTDGQWHIWGLGSYTWGGQSGDIPAPADYDGDGKLDLAYFRPSTVTWHILKSSTHYTTSLAIPYGLPGDIPVHGDYTGDGKAEPAVYRPSNGTWYVYGLGAYSIGLANSGAVPVPGDYDADGKTDIAVYASSMEKINPPPSTWTFRLSSQNFQVGGSKNFGQVGDIPLPSKGY